MLQPKRTKFRKQMTATTVVRLIVVVKVSFGGTRTEGH